MTSCLNVAILSDDVLSVSMLSVILLKICTHTDTMLSDVMFRIFMLNVQCSYSE